MRRLIALLASGTCLCALVSLPASAAPISRAPLWVRQAPQGRGSDAWLAVAVAPGGSRVYVTGFAPGPAGDCFSTAALSSAGRLSWETVDACSKQRNGTKGIDVAPSPDGSRVFVTGDAVAWGHHTGKDIRTAAYEAETGIRLWSARYDGPAHATDMAAALAVSPDGSRVFVTGRSAGTSGSSEVATIAYDAATGTRRWVARFASESPTRKRSAWGNDIAVRADGRLVFVGGVREATRSDHDAVVLAIGSAFGRLRWVGARSTTSPGHDEAVALAVGPSGAIFVTGTAWGGRDAGPDYATLAFGPRGGLRWAETYDAGGVDSDQARAIALSPDGSRIYVVGRPLVVAYSVAGVQLWTAPSAGALWDTGVVVTPDGSHIVVSGVNGDGVSEGFSVAGYDATSGGQIWSAAWGINPGTAGYRSGIAQSPDGVRAYVTGCVDFTGEVDLRRAAAAFATA